MAETLSILSIIAFVVAGVSFAFAVFFWFFFNIPTVISDLTGRTAKKSIAKMRATNEKTGVKVYKESKTNFERGKLTDAISEKGKSDKKKIAEDEQRPETGLLTDNKAEAYESEATGILDPESTGLLIDEDETAPLDALAQLSIKRTGGKVLTIIEEVMLIHTDEVIEC